MKKFFLFMCKAALMAALFFISAVITAMCLEQGAVSVLVYLAVLWILYFFFSVIEKKFILNLLLAVFTGYALGLLFGCDHLHIQIPFENQIRFLNKLPFNILGYLSAGFFLIFAAVVPSTAALCAKRCRRKSYPTAAERPRRHV